MSIGKSISTVFRNYATFEGRADRTEFWWWVVFNLLVLGVLNLLTIITVGDGSTNLGVLLSSAWGIATFLPSLAVTVRRLRDAGHHWGNVFWALIPIAGMVLLAFYLAQPPKQLGETVETTATA